MGLFQSCAKLESLEKRLDRVDDSVKDLKTEQKHTRAGVQQVKVEVQQGLGALRAEMQHSFRDLKADIKKVSATKPSRSECAAWGLAAVIAIGFAAKGQR